MLSPTEEIKSRLDVVEIIQGYLKLQKAGSNWKGLCPFHSEKSPSFMVSPSKQMWHCFGCAQGGDIFTFVSKIEGLEFGDALRILADRAGVKLSRQDPQVQSKRKRTYEVCEFAARFFQRQLLSGTGKEAVKYLLDRGVTKESIESFGLGWAPDTWQSLRNYLNGEGYADAEILEAGLVVERGSTQIDTVDQRQSALDYHDRFRHRVMFPINDANAQVIGFSGRLFDKIKGKTVHEDAGKYINTPNTVLYDKSQALYGLDKAKLAMRQSNGCVLVEGNLDVVMSHQAGVKNTVAPCGTAFSLEHYRVIKRYTDNLFLSFDEDAAGESALKRSVTTALANGFNVMVVPAPTGKDPADVVKDNPKLWLEAVAKPVAYMSFILNKSLAKFPPIALEGKKAVAVSVLPFIKSIASPLEKDHWLNELSLKIGVEKNILISELKTTVAPSSENISREPVKNVKVLEPANYAQTRQEEYLVALLVKYPELKKFLAEEDMNLFNQPNIALAARALIASEDFKETILGSSVALVGDFLEEFVSDPQAEFLKILNNLRRQYVQSRLKLIQADIKKAEAEGDTVNLELLLAEFNELSKKING